ncbi:uncharacterized protein [Amphiura filiformis]|uniref:uncharacterized protein n=1 Tax=Amphiura filiformis TaxID=82378 RepID=UPI003B20B663
MACNFTEDDQSAEHALSVSEINRSFDPPFHVRTVEGYYDEDEALCFSPDEEYYILHRLKIKSVIASTVQDPNQRIHLKIPLKYEGKFYPVPNLQTSNGEALTLREILSSNNLPVEVRLGNPDLHGKHLIEKLHTRDCNLTLTEQVTDDYLLGKSPNGRSVLLLSTQVNMSFVAKEVNTHDVKHLLFNKDDLKYDIFVANVKTPLIRWMASEDTISSGALHSPCHASRRPPKPTPLNSRTDGNDFSIRLSPPPSPFLPRRPHPFPQDSDSDSSDSNEYEPVSYTPPLTPVQKIKHESLALISRLTWKGKKPKPNKEMILSGEIADSEGSDTDVEASTQHRSQNRTGGLPTPTGPGISFSTPPLPFSLRKQLPPPSTYIDNSASDSDEYDPPPTLNEHQDQPTASPNPRPSGNRPPVPSPISASSTRHNTPFPIASTAPPAARPLFKSKPSGNRPPPKLPSQLPSIEQTVSDPKLQIGHPAASFQTPRPSGRSNRPPPELPPQPPSPKRLNASNHTPHTRLPATKPQNARPSGNRPPPGFQSPSHMRQNTSDTTTHTSLRATEPYIPRPSGNRPPPVPLLKPVSRTRPNTSNRNPHVDLSANIEKEQPSPILVVQPMVQHTKTPAYPTELCHLSIEDIAEILQKLNIPDAVVKKFREYNIDGYTFVSLDNKMMDELGVSALHKLLITQFKNGWRPHHS